MEEQPMKSIMAYEPNRTILFPSVRSAMSYYGIRSTRMFRIRMAWPDSIFDYSDKESPWDVPMVVMPDGSSIPLSAYDQKRRKR